MENLNDIYKILIFSCITYVYLFIIAKILGKKQIAQLTFIDYIVGITIGSIAAEMTTETDNPFYHYLIAMTIFVLFDLSVTLIGRKGGFMKKLINGKPLILIDDGDINYEQVKKSKLTVDEIAGLARDKGFFDMEQISYAILETNGKLSILPKSPFTPTVCSDFNIKKEEATLTDFVIIDGKMCEKSIENSNISEDKLIQMLSAQGYEIKDVFIAKYDEKTDKLTVHPKNKN